MSGIYSIENIMKLIKNPKQYEEFFRKLPYRTFWSINDILWETWFSEGEDFMKNDWDNLIILDACRYDLFKQLNSITGQLNRKFSKGSNSVNFMKSNFAGKELHDTVYISANPMWGRLRDDDAVFYYFDFLNSEWDEELVTAPPHRVKNQIIKAGKRFPNKRIIGHFMQPHTPYIGKEGTEFNKENGGIYGDVSVKKDTANVGDDKLRELIRDGTLTKQKLKIFYTENLQIVLEEVHDLIEKLDGKTIVTADHGELFLEKPLPFTQKRYTHPPIATRKLREVPWLIVDFDNRKTIKSDPPIENQHSGTNTINERLQSLGYKM